MPTRHAWHSAPSLLPCPLSFLKLMCCAPLWRPPACSAPGNVKDKDMFQLAHLRNTRWSRGWITWRLQELGLFSLANKAWQEGIPLLSSTPFAFLLFQALVYLLFFWQYMNKRLRKSLEFLDHVLHVTCIFLLPILHPELQSRGLDTELLDFL